MEPKQLVNTLEALLFVAGKPVTAKEFAKILELPETEIKIALETLSKEKKHNGVILLDNDGEYQLSTNSMCSPQVKNFLNSELREKLTDATVEVLAIVAYRQPISKAEIEAIRGVNSQYSVRSLLMRGLIEKIPNPHDARSFLYQTTTEFLMHLGLSSVKDLPEFEKLVSQIKLPETPALTQETTASETPKIAEPIADTPAQINIPQQPAPNAEPAPQEPATEENSNDAPEEDEDDEDDDENE